MKFLKTIAAIMCCLLVAFAVITIFEIVDCKQVINGSTNFQTFGNFTIAFFVMIAIVAIVYLFLLLFNLKAVFKGKGKIFNILMLFTILPSIVWIIPMNITIISNHNWSDSGANIVVVLFLCYACIIVANIIYSITAIVVSKNINEQIEQEKENRLIRRVGALEYHNPYNTYQNYERYRYNDVPYNHPNHNNTKPKRRR